MQFPNNSTCCGTSPYMANTNFCGCGNDYPIVPGTNPALQTWNGQAFVVADGSAQNPIRLPFLQVNGGAATYVVGADNNGVWSYYSPNLSPNLSGGSAGQVPWQISTNVTGFTATGTSGQLLQSGGTGSPTWITQNNLLVTATGSTTARTLANRFADVVNVKDFGAIGDGVTDDTAAIQGAINSSYSVYFPQGNYKIASSLNVRNFTNLYADPSAPNGDTTVNVGDVKLIFTGSGTGCINGGIGSTQIKYFSVYGMTLIASGTYNWIFNLVSPLACKFVSIICYNYSLTGGTLYGSYVAGEPSWVNTFTNCDFNVETASTSYNIDYSISDSFVTGCYFSGGKGVIDRGTGSTLYSNCHFDLSNSTGSGLTLQVHPTLVAFVINKYQSVVGCYFDVNAGYGIILDCSNTTNTTNNNVTITGCTFRNNNLLVGSADIWLKTGSYIVYGGVISSCAMSGVLFNSFKIDSNWKRATIIGNTSVIQTLDLTNADNTIISKDAILTNGPVVSYSSETFQGQTNVAGVFGTGVPVMLGSVTGNSPFIGSSNDSSNNPYPLYFRTNNTNRMQITSTGGFLLPSLQASTSYANDTAAAAGGVAIGQLYRNGSVVQIRVT